jgi:hypothetical protein
MTYRQVNRQYRSHTRRARVEVGIREGLPKNLTELDVIFWQDSTLKKGACHEEKTLLDGADHRRRQTE